MRGPGRYGKIGGLLLALGLLVACGGTAAPDTPVPPATTAATPAATTAPAATTRTVAATTGTATAAATRTTTVVAPATAIRTTTAPAGSTATRATAVASGATRTASPGTTGPAPAQAYRNLRALPNSRQQWVFTGFTLVPGVSGELRPTYEYNGNNQRVVVTAAGAPVTEAYSIDSRLYGRNPIGGGFIELNASNPLAAPVQALFDTPDTILTTLIPAGATFTTTGNDRDHTAMVNGRQVTRYTTTIVLTDLGFVDPSLRGQRGTAATAVFVDNQQGYIVALESAIRADATTGGGASARARLDVTDVGQVGPIAVPR